MGSPFSQAAEKRQSNNLTREVMTRLDIVAIKTLHWYVLLEVNTARQGDACQACEEGDMPDE